MIAALRPDVILFQEANDIDASSLEAWLNTHAGAALPAGLPSGWSATSVPGAGVAIASVHPIAFGMDPAISIPDPRRGSRTVRAAGALVSTPVGDLLAVSVHLKCCGDYGGREDQIRAQEAAAIRSWFDSETASLEAGEAGAIPMRVIAGDYNLVGGVEPRDVIAEGMAWAEPEVLGDGSEYTWIDAKSAFAAGRLDWFTYDNAGAKITETFILDTRRLDDASLAAAGLLRGDTKASDHQPLVVDLRPR